jgi:hypothetical protein
MHRTRLDRAVVITDAAQSYEAEFDRRRKRYAIMMAGRAVCVIGAACTYEISIWIALALIAGSAVLPWCAVIIANDGPPKKRRPLQAFNAGPTERMLPSAGGERTIDG